MRVYYKVAVVLAVLSGFTSCQIRQQEELQLLSSLSDLNASSLAAQYGLILDLKAETTILHGELFNLHDIVNQKNQDLLLKDKALESDIKLAQRDILSIDQTINRLSSIKDILDSKVDNLENINIKDLRDTLSSLQRELDGAKSFIDLLKAPETACVAMMQVDGMFGYALGNGVVIAPGKYLTAKHVWLDEKNPKPYIVFNDIKYPLTNRVEHPTIDLAIFDFDPKLYSGPYPEITEEMPEIGYPMWISSYLSGLRKGTVLTKGVFLGPKDKTGEMWMMSIHNEAGMSGSPVFHRGKIVGIDTTLFNISKGKEGTWTGFVPSKFIKDIFKP